MCAMAKYTGITIRAMGTTCEYDVALASAQGRARNGTDLRNSKVYISFGGLLLLLDGPYKKLSPLRQDYVYLLLKK